MDRSRFDARTVALALLCLAVFAFAASTLGSTTDTASRIGGGGGAGDASGFQGTPTTGDPGQSEDGRESILNMTGGFGGLVMLCVEWLKRPLVRLALLGGLVGIFLAGWWYVDEMVGLAVALMAGFLGVYPYLLLTSCRKGRGLFPRLTQIGEPITEEAGGLIGGGSPSTQVPLVTQVILLLVVGLLGVVAVLVLTGDHDQRGKDAEASSAEEEDEVGGTGGRMDVSAIGEAAGRAADRLEEAGAFENEVYRAWAEMTEHLSVDHPESSTPGEFATAAVAAGMDREDVDRLTGLFADVRYGGAEPTTEREREAIETLRRIEATYAGRTEEGEDA